MLICEPAAVTLLAAKVLLAPLCVVAVSLAGRRWGMAVAGVLGGLPVVAGPILLVETLLHGRGFGADAAAGTLLGLAALSAFVVVYGRVAAGPPPALAAVRPPWWDLPARALGALGLVLTLTALSGALGAHLSGLLAPFPIITSVLAVFTQAHGGFAQVSVLLRNFLVGFYGFAAFCFVLAIALPSMSTAAAFGLAVAAALAVQATIFLLRSRRPTGREPCPESR
jgi:hypothetical protein